MDDEKKDVEQNQDAEYAKAWEEADAKDGVVTPPPAKEDATDDEHVEAPPKKDDAAPVVSESEKTKTEETPPEKPLAGVEKALHDTKAYATTLATENAKLRKALEGRKSESDIAAAKASQEKAEADLKGKLDEAYKDYPELKGALDTITSELKTVKDKLTAKEQAEATQAKAAEERSAIVSEFEANVKPEVLKIHPDFDAIVKDPKGDFFAWAEKGSPALKAAVFNSMDPSDINWAVAEYKKARSSGDIDKLRKDEDARKENNLNLAHSLKGGSNNIPSSVKSEKKDDYEAGWDAAGKTLEKQGIK
jgi:hypothetical protein